MGDSPRIAFAIPVAGGSHDFLRRAIESVLRQTTPQWRLTIVDDTRDSDAARAVVAAYDDPRIAYVRKGAPHGMAHGWNACLTSAPCELLSILHADDELEPDFAREMIALGERHPTAALLFCNASVIDERGTPQFSARDAIKRFIRPRGDEIALRGSDAIARLCFGNFIMCPTIVYRRSLLGERRFSPTYRFVPDLDFVVETALSGGTIVGSAKQLFRYRRHAAQQTELLSRNTARIDEEIAYYAGLARRLYDDRRRSLALLARLRFATRLSGFACAFADARAGRFASGAAKVLRSVA